VLRLINFAHGDVYMVGAYVGYYLSRKLRGDQPSFVSALLVMLGAMVACAILGLIIERLAYRPVRRASRLTLLITAIGVSLFIENGGQLVFGPDPKFFPSLAPHFDFIVAGVRLTSEQITVIGVSFLLMILLRFFIMKTRTGKAMRAVSFNLDAAKLMGISTDGIIAVTFALGSALAAAGGVLIGMQIPKIDPLMGILYGLKAFVAAVLGGIGNVPGAVLGGLLIGTSEVMVVGYLSSTYRDAIAFGILILVLLLRPQGSSARSRRRRCEGFPRRGRGRRGAVRGERPLHGRLRRGARDVPLSPAGHLPGGNQRHPRGEPEPHQRLHRPVLHRARRLHGDRRLCLGLHHRDLRRTDAVGALVPAALGAGRRDPARGSRGGSAARGDRGILRRRAVAAAARGLPGDRDARASARSSASSS
jgi:branched-chain amino acid transport system permease protein